MTDFPKYDVDVQLTGTDGNAFALMGQVTSAIKDAYRNGDLPDIEDAATLSAELDTFRAEAMSGDYDNLLRTCCKWVNVS